MGKSRIAGITIEINGDTTGLQNALKGTNSRIKTTQDELKDVNRLLKLDPTNTELLKQKQTLLAQAVNETSSKLKTLREAEKQAADSVGKSGEITQEQYRALQREIVATEQELRSFNEQARGTGNALGNISEKAKVFGEKAQTAGKELLKVTAATAALGGIAIKTSADFESAMSNVQAISGATSEDMILLKDKAREMGEQTKFSATEAGEAMSYMAMAGWKTQDMLDGIEGVMNLAAASGEDLALTSDIVTDALTAFGMTAKDTNRFVDTLAATATNSNTNVAMLGESFSYCAPVCGALGYSAEDASIALGLMANSGIKASNSGTALRTLLTNMAKPTEQMAMAMEELGVSLTDSNGKMKSLKTVIEDLRKGFGQSQISTEELARSTLLLESSYENGELSAEEYETAQQELIKSAYGLEGAEKAKLAAMLAGKYGMSGLLAIVNATETDYDKLAESIYNSAGAAQNMANIMNDNLTGQITILKSQLQELAISIGEILMPYIKNLVTYMQGAVDKFNKLSNRSKEIIVVIIGIVAALGPLLIVTGKIATGISAIARIVPMLLSPTGLIIAAIVALIAIIAVLYIKCEDFRNFINSTASSLLAYIQQVTGELMLTIQQFWEWIQPYAEVYIQALLGFLSVWVEKIRLIVEFLILQVTTMVKLGLSSIKNTIELVTGIIESIISGTMTFIQGAIDLVMGIVSGDWERAWLGCKEMLAGIVKAIGGIISSLVSYLENTFRNLATLGIEWGKDFVSGLIKGIKSMVSSVGDAAKGVADKIKNFLHFSRPDTGPLRDYETWMPDFVGRMAEQIRQNQPLISKAAAGLAESMNVSQMIEVRGTESQKATSDTQINFNGNYSFNDKTDIDYFMNQAAQRLVTVR